MNQFAAVKDDYWAPRSCAIVGLAMILKTIKGRMFKESCKDLINEGLEYGGYNIETDVGWYHDVIVKLAQRRGLESKRVEPVFSGEIISYLNKDYYILASIESNTGGHLLLIYGYRINESNKLKEFVLHDSEKMIGGGGPGKRLSFEEFDERSKGRIIIFKDFSIGRMLNWWLTPKFPKKHIENILSYKPQGLKNNIRNFYRTWVIHPIKRRIAKYYLIFLRRVFDLKVVGITGSAGKTTTKEMVASILKLEGETVYSFANIDPVYNIPTTILKCRPSTKYLALEMGIEYPGEMDFYLWLAMPDVGVITNIYPTHTLYLGGIEGVANEKSKLLRLLPNSSVAIIGNENKFFEKIVSKIKAKVTTFGREGEVKAEKVRLTSQLKTKFVLIHKSGNISIQLPVLGKQFVENALAASTAAISLGISMAKVKKGLENFISQEHRMSIRKLKNGLVLIDDSYNNNPEAARKAIETLIEVKGNRKTMFVFGDMLELGKHEVKYHKEIGTLLNKSKVDYVVGVGPLSKYVVKDKNLWVKNWQDAVQVVRPLITKNMIILVKGSRSIGLDNLARILI